jgi:hypothetical protein
MTFKEYLTGSFYIYTVENNKIVRFPLLIGLNGEAKVINTPNGIDYLGNIKLNDNFAALTLVPTNNIQSKTSIILNGVEFKDELEFIVGVYTTIGKLFVESPNSNFPSAGRIVIQKSKHDNIVIGIDKYQTPKNLIELLTTNKIDITQIRLPETRIGEIEKLEGKVNEINKTWSDKFKELENILFQVKNELAKFQNAEKEQNDRKQKIKILIGNGDLKKSIEELLLSCIGKPAYNEVILLNSRLSNLEMELRINVVDEDKSRIERNKIIRALLEIIDNNL